MKILNLFLAIGISLFASSFVGNLVGLFHISSTLIYFLLISFLALILIVIGFMVYEKEVIASGLLGAGMFLILFSTAIASISKVFSSISSLSMMGTVGKSSVSVEAIPYLNLLFIAIGLIVFLVLAMKIKGKE